MISGQTWRRKLVFTVAMLGFLGVIGYAVRCTLLLNVARIFLNHDAQTQEHRDGLSIYFTLPSSVWVRPLKNVMNEIWMPLQTEGVNYFTFAAPANLFRAYSERSNPRSPYYQAWVGGYVTKRKDGTLPSDIPMWASQVTALDQRSWLSAMGDPMPIANFGAATPAGNIEIDGHILPLWHGVMSSHSDLSADPQGPLATLLGMPPRSTWPQGTTAFHAVTLDGYFVCWSDAKRNVSVVIYSVAAVFDAGSGKVTDNRAIKDQLLSLMRSARIKSTD